MDISFDKVVDWLSSTGASILLIVLGAVLVRKFGMMLIERLIRDAIKSDSFATKRDKKQREDTLIAIIHAAFGVVLSVIVGMLVLDELGLNIGPLIASAGIIGVALGFGGQWLIKDLIAGLFVVLENQYRVGDVITLHTGVAPVTGAVEDISLRMTMLRDLDGQLHHVPNGSITVATNLSKDFSGINLDIGIAYEADLEKAIEIINTTGIELQKDKEWQDKVMEAPTFLRVEDLGDSSVVLKITGSAQPLEQWAVTGELRKRIKIAFDKAGIGIPYPQRVVHTIKD